MALYKTRNPVPSPDMRDTFDNNQVLDEILNSKAKITETRTGEEVKTWTGVMNGFDEKINDIANAASTPTVASIAAGIALTNTTANKYFKVIPGGPDGLLNIILFENVSGTAVPRDTQANQNDIQRAVTAGHPWNWFDMPYSITDKNFIPIIGIKGSGLAHVVTDELPGVDLLHHLYRYGVFDPETGDLLHGYTWDGGAALGGSRILDADFRFVWTDESGNILMGIRWDGTLYPSMSAASDDVTLYARGKEGHRTIWAYLNGAPYQLTSSGDSWAPKLVGNIPWWLSAVNGGVLSEAGKLPAVASVATFANRILHLLSYGQSLSVGSLTTPANTAPHCANRLLTLQQGVMANSQATAITESSVTPLRPLASVWREAPLVAMSISLQDSNWLPVDVALLSSAHGQGGQTIAQLERGSIFYANILTAVTYSKPYVESLGLQYSIPFLDWIQGEADRNLPAGEYTAQLSALRSHLDADIRAITGSSSPFPMLLDQISNFTAYNMAWSNVPLEQLQIALDHPGLFYCAGPKYWLQTVSDGVHMTTESSQRLGCMHARAAASLLSGKPWLPTYCTGAVRKGKTVTLSFYTPVSPLVIDTTNVSNPGNYGLRWIDDTASASISSIAVHSNNTVTLTLNNEPTGNNPQIGIADYGVVSQPGGPFTGARSNLRDSAPDIDILGTPYYNWACHQRIAVITEA